MVLAFFYILSLANLSSVLISPPSLPVWTCWTNIKAKINRFMPALTPELGRKVKMCCVTELQGLHWGEISSKMYPAVDQIRSGSSPCSLPTGHNLTLYSSHKQKHWKATEAASPQQKLLIDFSFSTVCFSAPLVSIVIYLDQFVCFSNLFWLNIKIINNISMAPVCRSTTRRRWCLKEYHFLFKSASPPFRWLSLPARLLSITLSHTWGILLELWLSNC